ncbi:ATP-dependent RNA helicase DBP10 [Lentinus tigrinus ALCF2SS1-6]|uniref:RNA helicase n=1 Tax=Lentinus tigrinus ALCF2SS1-6 TaxID=1328759 RepID=A0A5C2S7U3_9APHY|nr:ATP-dependent RNA helicase DBP10 [Lentinus tigrinus ALCF2SS1-6]
MVSVKRKRSFAREDEDAFSEVSLDYAQSDDEIDISTALTGKRPKVARTSKGTQETEGSLDDDDELQDFIRESIAKRDVKQGTELLKKTKGKTKIAKGEVGGGSFQSMGLYPWLLRSLTLQGYRIPTPIQRLSIPALLSNPPRDLVGMARTGSGKSLAYMVPLVQRLGGRHSATFGARALILLPARELALQILKVGKELARGWHAGEGDHAGDVKDADDGKKGQSLRWGLVVGGESLDEQFEMISNNPDIIIATPGRLLHLIVEMNLDLKSVQYVVFDEADRLFEMGFQTALTEILHRLPPTRQTLLFSATLPKSLVEFAKAGLQNPKLVRLDAETKISADLKMAFFSVKQAEKDACLLVLLRDIIGVPLGSPTIESEETTDKKGKGKAKTKHTEHAAAPHQTLIFAATKHHVEYLTNLLTTAGYSVSHIYGSLDQTARTLQMEAFRRGRTNVLVVTDVAARGIDIPVLENVVNYDFPQGSRVFVHRVGRTARAGRQGWAWSFVTAGELPYLLDLQLFLGRPVKNEVSGSGEQVYTESLILGPLERDRVDEEVDYIKKLYEENHNLSTLRDVMRKGHAMYERSKGKASPASYHKTKEILKDGRWGYTGTESGVHPVFLRKNPDAGKKLEEEAKRRALLKVVDSFRPAETILEIGARGNAETAALMKQRRKALSKAARRASLASTSAAAMAVDDDEDPGHDQADSDDEGPEMADEEDIAAVFDTASKKSKAGKGNFRDEEFYMSHYQKDADTEKGYSLRDGASFAEQARNVAFDLTGDEASAQDRQRRELKWDKKKKRFVKGTGEGADNVKLVKTESGVKLPVTYRSGRFDEWKAKSRVSLPKVGEAEAEGARGSAGVGAGGRKYKHKQVVAAKPLDKMRGDYERKVRHFKKSDQQAGGDEAPARSGSSRPPPGKTKGSKGSRYGGKPMGKVRSELKTVDQIRKARKVTEQKRAKNARPTKKRGKR